jgi:hypothetical protein
MSVEPLEDLQQLTLPTKIKGPNVSARTASALVAGGTGFLLVFKSNDDRQPQGKFAAVSKKTYRSPNLI